VNQHLNGGKKLYNLDTRTGINTVFGQMADLTASNPKDETLITKELSQFIHLVKIFLLLFSTR
jgi:hypothetical protein